MAAPKYGIELALKVTEQVAKHVKETKTYSTKLEGFEVVGGLVRFIMADGRDGIGDGDVMSEFYQAKQFKKINVVKQLNYQMMVVDKIYYLKLSFDFTLLIQSLSPSSRFRSLQLNAKNAQIVKPPDRGVMTERLSIKYSDSEIYYFYNEYDGNSTTKVRVNL